MLNSILLIVGIILMVLAVGIQVIPRALGHKKGLVRLSISFLLLGIGCLGVFSNGLIYYAEPGYNYLVQYPTGHQIGETSPGYHFKFWGTAEPFKKFITVRASKEKSGNVSAELNPIPVRFIDTVQADVEVTARFALPNESTQFKTLAVAFRTQDNFEESTLIPVLKEVTRNAARTMAAQDYIAGRGGDFENAILDQLREGTYLLAVKEIRPEGKSGITDIEGEREIDSSQIVRYEVEYKKDDAGNLLRKPTALKDYFVQTAQSNVASVDPEKKFKDMLGKQRDAAAEASVKKQEAKRAEYDKQKIIAEGEASKAQIKVELEQEQIRKLIAAETRKKEQEIALKEAEIRKEQAEIDAKAKKITADADAYAKKKVIEADGALEQKLAALVEMNRDNANALSQRAVPANYFASGAGGSDGGYDSEMVRQLQLMNLNTIKALNVDTKVE